MKLLLRDSKNQGIGPSGAIGALLLVASSFLIAFVFAPGSAQARAQTDGGEAGFVASCASCHQADGAGIPGTFPPLAGNPAAADPAYVAEVIRNGLTGPIEVAGVSYDSVMPPVPALEGAELDAVVAYVVSLAGGSEGPTTDGNPTEPTLPAEPTVGDPDRGRDLFLGSNGLDNGGAACVACHTAGAEGNLGGGGLGPDLTTAFDRLGGEAGLTGWLGNPPSATMMPIFVDHPMTEDETADLVAYLATTSSAGTDDGPIDVLLLAGFAGLVALIGGMAIAGRGGRQTYVERLRSRG